MWPEWILNDLLVIYYLRSYTYNPLQVALSMKSKVNRYVSYYDSYMTQIFWCQRSQYWEDLVKILVAPKWTAERTTKMNEIKKKHEFSKLLI